MSTNTPTVHKVRISVPFGKLQSFIDWCDKNCTGEWKYMEDLGFAALQGQLFEQPNDWVFIFESERDCVAFTLWKK